MDKTVYCLSVAFFVILILMVVLNDADAAELDQMNDSAGRNLSLTSSSFLFVERIHPS